MNRFHHSQHIDFVDNLFTQLCFVGNYFTFHVCFHLWKHVCIRWVLLVYALEHMHFMYIKRLFINKKAFLYYLVLLYVYIIFAFNVLNHVMKSLVYNHSAKEIIKSLWCEILIACNYDNTKIIPSHSINKTGHCSYG